MIEIFPATLEQLNHSEALETIKTIVGIDFTFNKHFLSTETPMVQLSYDEISQQDLDRIFSFAAIASTDLPVGIPFDVEVPVSGHDFVIYSLSRLRLHIREVEPEIAADFARLGSMNNYVDYLADDMTAAQYLVAGLLECIQFAIANDYIVIVHW